MTEQQFSHIDTSAVESAGEPAAELWRNEVQSRIARYKTRRGRRVEGAFSMRFPFPAEEILEPAENAAIEATVSLIAELTADIAEESVAPTGTAKSPQPGELPVVSSTVLTVLTDDSKIEQSNWAPETVDLVLEPVPEPEPERYVDLTPRPRPKRKVIAFPKHLSVAPESVYRLADPVMSEVPRILDVPEELQAIPTTPFLDGLELDSVTSANESRDREHVELPFQAVRVPRRVVAGVIDGVTAAIGVAIFAAVAYKIIPQISITKSVVVGGVAIASLLWSVYQYLFVVYGGQTPGMMAAKLRLRTFTGKSPSMMQRRTRVLGFYLSALSLGMGLMWAFVDIDGFCWHDRLSRTYLSNRE